MYSSFFVEERIKIIYLRLSSISIAASALAALIRVSLTLDRRELYVSVSRTEPIFHLEALTRSLSCSDPEKKWLLLLVRLARETVIAVREPSLQESFDPVLGGNARLLCPSPKTALLLRQRLIRALKMHRCAVDSFSIHNKPE